MKNTSEKRKTATVLHCSLAETGPKRPKACYANSFPRDLGRNLGLGRETARPPGLKPAHPSPARSRPHDRIERPEINAPMYKNPKITAGIRTLCHFSPFSRLRALSLTFLPPAPLLPPRRSPWRRHAALRRSCARPRVSAPPSNGPTVAP